MKEYNRLQAELANSKEEVNSLRAEVTQLRELNQKLESTKLELEDSLNQERSKGKVDQSQPGADDAAADSKKNKHSELKQYFESLESKNKERRSSIPQKTPPKDDSQTKTKTTEKTTKIEQETASRKESKEGT